MPRKRTQAPIASPLADARKLQRNAIASADELRAFLGELRGKSPKEMLGEAATSDLGRSAMTASIGAIALIFALTVIPFAWSKMAPPSEVAPPPELVSGAPETEPPPSPVLPADNRHHEAADKLGIGGEKSAPQAVNPLDSTNSDLLEGLE